MFQSLFVLFDLRFAENALNPKNGASRLVWRFQGGYCDENFGFHIFLGTLLESFARWTRRWFIPGIRPL